MVELLDSAEVRLVVDVRTVPRSQRNPQFNRETLPGALVAAGIGYEHLPALGGLRGGMSGVPADVNAFWTNQSFRNYADYAMGEAWRAGFARLLELGRERRCAIMCAEAVWWRCHRRIIVDYLLSDGQTVFHILGPNHVVGAQLTPAATRGADGALTYPTARDERDGCRLKED